MARNYWSENRYPLSTAFLEKNVKIRSELIARAILLHCKKPNASVVDLGGGCARQALCLAEAGMSVTVVDSDKQMTDQARKNRDSSLPHTIHKLRILDAPIETGWTLLKDEQFDVVCCHSVIPYFSDETRLFESLLKYTSGPTLLSLVSVNPDALAMRSALSGRWDEALDLLTNNGRSNQADMKYNFVGESETKAFFGDKGFHTVGSYGVGIFSDHLTGEEVEDLHPKAIDVEWFGGTTDPYRTLARCYHLLMERS
ncbi:methyltransferase domain-containing protein [Labrenzia sp. R4_1]|uniref:class I SAM-dependent methyltransferase n=1 Tax=Labrenzia sp. R4_1 TaxID=2821106 RepID=UPI001ADC1409|nr:class I SAM-dependent methyltransferase [Labrenzia sp. R4_1]MBO9424714.1 methyltransferase domain-containing protein [Labrenzia sp. R4_1]